jgi:ABC-2 type transport system permease protein
MIATDPPCVRPHSARRAAQRRRVQEGSPWLATVCRLNPFTHAVELIRFAFWGKVEPVSLAVLTGCTAVFLAAAIVASDPGRGMLMRRGG